MRENINNDIVAEINTINQFSSITNTNQPPNLSETHIDTQPKKTKPNLFYSFISKPQLPPPQLNKKPKLFQTINKPIIPKEDIPIIPPIQNNPKPSIINHCPIFKENYLDLLVTSANNLLSSGSITIDYLNSLTFPLKQFDISYSTNEDELPITSKKCENPICAVVVENYHTQLTKTKFDTGKQQTMLLCCKCYCAFKQGQYCFYCNIIYRDFAFNQQYYDKNKWIQCDYCQRWEHVQCEVKKGFYSQLEELNNDEGFKYECPVCRGKDKIAGKNRNQGNQYEKVLNKKRKRGFNKK